MVPAPNPIRLSVNIERLVVNQPETVQVGDQMTEEPKERLCLAKAAQGDVQVLEPPTHLQRAARRCEAQTDRLRPRKLFLRDKPEFWQQWLDTEAGHGGLNPRGEGLKQIGVAQLPALERNFGILMIELNETGMKRLVAERRNPDGGRFGKIVINDDVCRQSAKVFGELATHEILDPHTGVEKFGLMPAEHQRPIAPDRIDVGSWLTQRSQVGAAPLQQILPGNASEFAGRLPLEVMIPRVQPMEIGPGQSLAFIYGRLGKNTAIGGRGPETVAHHPAQLPVNCSPLRATAAWKTSR